MAEPQYSAQNPRDWGQPGYGFVDALAYMAFGKDRDPNKQDIPGGLRGLANPPAWLVTRGLGALLDWWRNRDGQQQGQPGQISSMDFEPQPWKPNYTPATNPYQTMNNLEEWSGYEDPFGYVSQTYGPEDGVAAGIEARFGDRFPEDSPYWEAQAMASQGQSPGRAPSRGSGMSVEYLDMGNGMKIPVISGPKWEGPPGLPWTYGADPRSYPYAYIPPDGSWENAPGAVPWSGGTPAPGVPGSDIQPRQIRTPEWWQQTHGGRGGGPSIGGYRDVDFGNGGGGGSISDWANFNDLTGDYAY